jgi:hypothetical protein
LSSDLACVGLGVGTEKEFDDLVRDVGPAATSVGRSGRVEVVRWQDPGGARLVFRMRGGVAESFVPSFAGSPGVRLGTLQRLNDDVWSAAVADESGDQLTSAAFELEEGGLVDEGHPPETATMVALGRSITIHTDEAAFKASQESAIDDGMEANTEPPADFVKRGLKWPMSMAAESFISAEVFGASAETQATALMNGIVLRAERRTTTQTGQTFVVARVRCIGMELDLCLAGIDHPDVPEPGQVIGGMVFLVASLGSDFVSSSAAGSFLSRVRHRIGRCD